MVPLNSISLKMSEIMLDTVKTFHAISQVLKKNELIFKHLKYTLS